MHHNDPDFDVSTGIHGFQSARAQYLHRLLLHPLLKRVPE